MSSQCPEGDGFLIEAEKILTGRPLSLKTSFLQLMAGNAVYALCQWGMLGGLAKLSSPKTVGVYALALALTSPVFLFTNLSLRSVFVTDVRGKYDFSDYFKLRLLTNGIAAIVLIAILIVGNYDAVTIFVVAMMTIARIGDSISDIVYGLRQTQNRIPRIAVSRSIQGGLQIFVLIGIMLITKNIIAAVAAMACASVLITLVYDLQGRNLTVPMRELNDGSSDGPSDGPSKAGPDYTTSTHTPAGKTSTYAGAIGTPRIYWPSLFSLAKMSLPLGIVACLDVLVLTLPRYYIEHIYGTAALGYFSAVAYLMVIGGTVISALADAVRPTLARHFITAPKSFIVLLIKLLVAAGAVGLAGILVAIVGGRSLLTILYRPDYATHVDLLVWVMVAAFVWYLSTFCTTAIVAARSFRVLVLLLSATAISVAVACHVLVPHYGLIGAGWALCAGMITRLAGSGLILYCALAKTIKQGKNNFDEIKFGLE